MERYLCFDIGGSSLKCAAADEEGKLFHTRSYPMSADIEGLLAHMKAYQKDITMQGITLLGAAISSCGAVDCDSGMIGGSSAVPFIHGFSWKERIQRELGMDCEIENDANCAALSELFFGKAKNIQDMAFLVIGTGVGGAIVRNRKICHGAHRYGGEFGMMLVKQADGSVQNFSLCASTSSMVRKMEALTAEEWNGVRVFEEAQQGNAMCREVIQTFYEELAFGVFNVQHMLDPEMILFGGAISARRDFTQRIMEAYEKLQKGLDFETLTPRLECCTYRQDANLLGALAHYLQRRELTK